MPPATEAHNKVLEIKARRKLMRKRRYQPSRLMKHRTELVQLRQAGASYRDLQLWLRLEKRVKVADTTVMRYLQSLPEHKG